MTIPTGPDPRHSEPPQKPEGDTVYTKSDVDKMLADLKDELSKANQKIAARIPNALIVQNGGGPGNDNHQSSWSLAEQELAQAGETLEHWVL